MKKLVIAFLLAGSLTAHAQDYDREYAYLKLLDMGYPVTVEDIGEMFKHHIFVLSNSSVCADLGASLYDDSGESCLLQVKEDGSIGGFYSDNPNALYE